MLLPRPNERRILTLKLDEKLGDPQTPLPNVAGCRAWVVGDNGTGLTSHAVLAWCEDTGVEWHCIAPGKPRQTGFVKAFNGRLRDEAWRTDYNTVRPHSSLGGIAPA